MIGLVVIARIFGRVVRRLARDPRSRGLLTLASLLVGGGTVFFHQAEDFSWIDSFYFTIITLTTVGYGDLAPQTTVGKLFTVGYVLIGVGILVALVSEVATGLVDARSGPHESRYDDDQRNP